MGAGPNFVLDKGYLAEGTAAYQYGQPVGFGTAVQSVKAITVANTMIAGVCQENVDAVKVTTGKVFINIRKMGISRVLAGAAFSKGDRLTVDATGRFIAQVTAGGAFYAVAEEAATAAGQLVEAYLCGPATI